MPLFTWTETFSVGSPSMDRHHQRLFDIMNRMHDAMKAGEADEKIQSLIRELIEYTIYHFSEEERLMAQQNYAGLAAQQRAHRAFVEKMQAYQQEAEQGMAIFVVSKVAYTAMTWLKDHILVMDKQYEQALKGL